MNIQGQILSAPTGFNAELVHVGEDTAYVFGNRPMALDLNTGALRWSEKIEKFREIDASNRLVAVVSGEDVLYCLAKDSGAVLWSYRIPVGITTYPSCDDRSVFLTVGRKLLYFDPRP